MTESACGTDLPVGAEVDTFSSAEFLEDHGRSLYVQESLKIV